jgi:hypothetical protein
MKKNLSALSVLCISALLPMAANAIVHGKISGAVNSGVNAATDAANRARDEANRAAAEAKRVADEAAAAAQRADDAARTQGFANSGAAAAMGYADSAKLTTYGAYARAAGYANLAAAETASRAAGYASFVDQTATAQAQGFSDAAVARAKGYTDKAILTTYSNYAKAGKYTNLAAAEAAASAAGFTGYIEQVTIAQANGFADASEAIAKGYSSKAMLVSYAEYRNAAAEYAKAATYVNVADADAAAKRWGYLNYADRLTKLSKPFAEGEFARLTNHMKKPWVNEINQSMKLAVAANTLKTLPPTQAELQKLGAAALSAITQAPGFDIVQEMALQCAGNVIATSDSIRAIAPQIAAMQNLQPQQLNALYRVVRTLVTRAAIDQQMAADMKTVGVALGYFQKNFPANFSIAVVGDYATPATYNMGGNIAVAYSMNTFPDNQGKYRSALTVSVGPTASLVKTEGLSLGLVFGLNQGDATEAEGASYGIGSTVGSYNGGLSWGLPLGFQETVVKTAITLSKQITDPRKVKETLLAQFKEQINTICAQPSVSGGVTLPYTKPEGLAISFSAGYTNVITTFRY